MILLSRIDAANKDETTRRASVLMGLAGALCAVALAGCGGSTEEPGSRPVATASNSSTSSTPNTSSSTPAAAPPTTGATPAPATTVATQATGAAPQSAAPTGARADAICVKRNNELKGAPLDAGSLSAIASTASRRASIERNALAELNALSPPTGKTKPWKMLAEQTNEVLANATKLADAARAGNADETTRELAAATRTQFGLIAAGVNVGAKHCIQVG
jgi:hypothetical protein